MKAFILLDVEMKVRDAAEANRLADAIAIYLETLAGVESVDRGGITDEKGDHLRA